jgi:citrate lyase subunit beta/citryl-CoA lyase
LFVAATDRARIAGLPKRNADLAVLDLEDAIALPDKDAARSDFPGALAALAAEGQAVGVRVNAEMALMEADLDAAIRPGLTAVMLPKSETPAQLERLDGMITALESARGLRRSSVSVIALIESPSALPHLHNIAAAPRLSALALGSEDFSARLGTPPTFDSLDLPARLIALAAAAHSRAALAVPFSIADFTDLAGFEQAARKGRAFGATGGLCIHPAQVGVVNRVFAPTEAELTGARSLVNAWTAAGQPAVMTFEGRMIDRPVILRAARLLHLEI